MVEKTGRTLLCYEGAYEMKKVKIKDKEFNLNDDAYALYDAIKDLTLAIRGWKR